MTRPSDVDCRAVSPWPAERRRRLTTGTEKRKNPGDDLFSRKAALSVSSALESLTSVFGMGTGVTSSVLPPGKKLNGVRSPAGLVSSRSQYALG